MKNTSSFFRALIMTALLVSNCNFLYSQDITNDISNPVNGITAGRTTAIATGLIALSSLIIASYYKRNIRKGVLHKKIVIPRALAILSICLAIIQLIVVRGAVFGSGSGKAGSLVAIIISLVSLIVGYNSQKINVNRVN